MSNIFKFLKNLTKLFQYDQYFMSRFITSYIYDVSILKKFKIVSRKFCIKINTKQTKCVEIWLFWFKNFFFVFSNETILSMNKNFYWWNLKLERVILKKYWIVDNIKKIQKKYIHDVIISFQSFCLIFWFIFVFFTLLKSRQ